MFAAETYEFKKEILFDYFNSSIYFNICHFSLILLNIDAYFTYLHAISDYT